MGRRVKVSERIVLDPGYRRASGEGLEQEVRPTLAQKKIGERVRSSARAQQRKGLNEAEWIAMMQSSGVGRPSTYAETLAKVRQHRYVEEVDGQLRLTERGRMALEWLETHCPEIFTVEFSAQLEILLDELATGQRKYREVVQGVWRLLE